MKDLPSNWFKNAPIAVIVHPRDAVELGIITEQDLEWMNGIELMFSSSDPGMCCHVATERCARHDPHHVNDCGEMRDG